MLKLGITCQLAFLAVPSKVFANADFITGPACDKLGADTPGCSGSKRLDSADGYWSMIVDVFIYAAGALAVVFLIIGGIRYITAVGDPQKISSAKNTVIYSVIGLVVVILARLIVGYVIGNL